MPVVYFCAHLPVILFAFLLLFQACSSPVYKDLNPWWDQEFCFDGELQVLDKMAGSTGFEVLADKQHLLALLRQPSTALIACRDMVHQFDDTQNVESDKELASSVNGHPDLETGYAGKLECGGIFEVKKLPEESQYLVMLTADVAQENDKMKDMVEILHQVMATCNVHKSTPTYLGMSKASDAFQQSLTRKNIHCLLAHSHVQTVQCSAEVSEHTPQAVSENDNYHHPLSPESGVRGVRLLSAEKKKSFDDDKMVCNTRGCKSQHNHKIKYVVSFSGSNAMIR